VARTGKQPTEIGGAPFEEEVVVGAHAHELELVVVHGEEVLAPEPAHVRIEDLGPDAGFVEVVQSRRGVVGARVAVGIGRRVFRGEHRPTGRRGDPDRADPPVLQHPDVLPVDALDVRYRSHELLRDTRRPDVRRFGDMAVGVDDGVRGGHAAIW
jgi:hypothetical protein